jgi:hypothetical protein
MIIFISLTLLLGLGIFLLCKSWNWNTEVIGATLTVVCGMLLIMCTISLIINPIKVKSNINKFLATEITIETARENGVVVENAAIQHKIIESNQWLVKEQYYNSTIFGLWIPDEVDNLKPIK